MDILEVCKVTPNVSSSQLSLPLTFLDMFWLRLDPASRLFFYEFTQPNTDFLKIILPKLKSSLSIALQHYLPIVGNLRWPQDSDKPIIQYRIGDGISLTVAETQADFMYLSGDKFRESLELHSLLPDFPTSETENPVMTLQITLFPDKGFSIGYVANHSVMDGKSVSIFMHSWAYICKNGEDSILPPELTPSFDRTFVKHHAELEKIYPRGFGQKIDPESRALMKFDIKPPFDTMLGTFRLTRENIDNLKKSMFTYWKENEVKTTTHLSTFIVTSAYVFVCLTKAKKITAKKTFLGINIDARARLDPPVPPTYFGNCVLGYGCGRDTEETSSEDGFALAVEDLIEALVSLNEGAVKVAERLNNLISSIAKDSVGFAIAGSPRFELYKVNFGWGLPKKVEMVSIAKSGAFYLSDTRDSNGGIEIGIVLRKDESENFESLFVSGLQSC